MCVPRGISSQNRPKYLLARSAIIRHLQTNLQKGTHTLQLEACPRAEILTPRSSEAHPVIKLHVFESVKSREFVEFLKTSGVYFVMAHDGANPVAELKDPAIQTLSEKAQAEVQQQESSRKVLFRTMICFIINQGYNIALINGLEWQDTKVRSTNTPINESSTKRRLDYDHGR